MICTHGYQTTERRCDAREARRSAQRTRRGYIGGIAYALRLLNSPPLKPGGAPINLLAAQGVLENMLDGHADWYERMADSEMQRRAMAVHPALTTDGE